MQYIKKNYFGIDIGLANLGFAIIDENKKLISYGTIITSPDTDYSERINIIYDTLSRLVDFFKPKGAVVENIFHGRNNKTFMNISNIQGIIFLLLNQKKISYRNINPNEVKKNLMKKHLVTKKEVIEEVKKIFNIHEKEKIIDDIADAIAIAMNAERIFNV